MQGPFFLGGSTSPERGLLLDVAQGNAAFSAFVSYPAWR